MVKDDSYISVSQSPEINTDSMCIILTLKWPQIQNFQIFPGGMPSDP